ncbi:MAG: hypothetical protein SX243_04490 [Acidobacteriota bacterium]|nr:hypothetical protein [Acidobacteriota bacterium]
MNDRELRQALSELPQERAGEDFTARVLQRLDSLEAPESKSSPGWFSNPWAMPAAAALGTVLVVGLLVAVLSAWPGGLFDDGADSMASVGEEAAGPRDAVAEGAAAQIPDSRAALPVAVANPEVAEGSEPRNPGEASSRSLRAQQLRAEQRRLAQELVELRRQMNREPAVLMGGAGGERLLVPLVPEGRRAGGLRTEAPARLASFDGNSPSAGRGYSNRPVRVVPASVTTF